MSTRTKLDEILGDEAKKIGEHLKNRIEEHITILDDCISNLKNAIVQNKAATETQEFQLEKELLDCQTKLKESRDMGQEFRSQISDLETKLTQTKKSFEDLQTEHCGCTKEIETLRGSYRMTEQEKKELGELIEKKEKEIMRQNEDLQLLTVRMTESNTAKYEALLKVEEIQIQELNWQHQRKRLEQEKDLLAKQVAALNQEVAEKSQEILRLRKECTTQSLELRADLEQRTDETRMAQKQLTDIKNVLQEKDKKVDSLAKRVNEVEQNHLQAEEHFHQEIKAQAKLSELYKKSADDAGKRVEELVGKVEEMHKLLKETADSHHQLEHKLNESQEGFDAELKEKDATISSLRKELEHANQLLVRSKALGFSDDSLEKMFPTAAATSKALKSGATLTQIYAEYVKSQEDLQKEKTEKQHLNQQLQHILAEIEDNTPLIKKRFQEYQTALETISCLRAQLATSITDQEKIQAKSDDACRITGFLQRENERLKQTSADLSQQVRILLKELEEARGNHVPMDDSQEPEISSSDEKTADTVITSRLVTFRGIEELQEKNQMLLSVIRDLSEQQEEQEKTAMENRTAELKRELEEAMVQLDTLRKERTKQAELVEAIVQQRDTYRTLLSQYQSISPLRSVTPLLSSTPQPGMGRTSLEESKLSESLKEVKTDYEMYKREMTENIRMLNEQLDKFRDEASDLKIQNARLSSQVSYSQERYDTVHSNLETYKNEVSILREMNQKLSTSITQHQKTIAVLRQDLITTQEQLSKAEVSLQNLQAEKDLLKSVELRLLHEKDSHQNEQQVQSHLLANLQAVQNNLERLEVESRLLVNNQLQKAEEEVVLLRKKLESEEERYKSAVIAWENRVQDLHGKMSADQERQAKTQDELVDAYAQVHSHSRTICELEVKLAAAPKPAAAPPPPVAVTPQPSQAEEGRAMVIKNMKSRLNELNAEVQTLRGNLSVSQKSMEQFRNLSSELEKRLVEDAEAAKIFRETTDRLLKEKKAQLDVLQKRLDEVEQSKVELSKNSDGRTRRIQELDKLVSELNQKLRAAEGHVTEARRVEQQARQDCQKQSEMMIEAQEQYQRELMLHASAVDALTKLKEQVGGFQHKLSTAEESAQKWEANLIESRRSWQEQELLLKQESETIQEKCQELETQNSALLQQLELMSSQMAALKTKEWSSVPGLEESAQNAEYTVEVVRYLRKEKGIAMAKFEAIEAECSRVKVRLEFVERQLAETRSELSSERERAQVAATTESQHRELLQKVEMLNILTESNQMMRSEKEALEKKATVLQQQVQKLESQLIPLERGGRDLQSRVDAMGAENGALRTEIRKWQTRCNHLLEQSRKTDPEDFKKLQEENVKLKKELNNLSENLGCRDAELSQVAIKLADAQKELEASKAAVETAKKNANTVTQEMDAAKNELAEQQKTSLQVKKIARKYKTQFDELKVQFTELEGRSAAAETDTAAARQQAREEIQQEMKEAEEGLKKKIEELEKQIEEMEKSAQEETARKAASQDREERARKLMLQAKKRIATLTAERDKANKERENSKKELEKSKAQLKSVKQTSEEENLRLNSLKSQLDGKLNKLEKELKLSRERSERLEKQVEELTQKVVQQQKQVTKPSTAIERSSVAISEPLTANIRPLTPPMVTSVGGGTLRHAPHPSAPSSRLPPTASIRPMAIGASTSTATVHQTAARMVAVPPTTANIPAADEAPVIPVTTAHILPTVPQATVQPTPVAPSTIVAPTSEQPTAPIAVEQADDSRSANEGEEVTTCLAATSPQTQVVTPTVKRTREEIDSPREGDSSEGSSASASTPQSKRIRMVSEASQTIERATVVTSSSSSVTLPAAAGEPAEVKEGAVPVKSEEAVIPERPGVIVTPEPQPIAQQESSNQSEQPETEPATVEEEVSPLELQLPDSPTPPEDVAAESGVTEERTSPAKAPATVSEEAIAVDKPDDQTKQEPSQEEAEEDEEDDEVVDEEAEEEYEEGMDDEEGEPESYEEEQMQETGFSQEEEEDDMAEDLPFDGDGEEMAEPPTEEVEIIDEDDSQMDAQETAAVPSASQDESIVSQDSNVQGVVPTAAIISTEMSEGGGLQTAPLLSMGHHRPPILPRVPGRAERLPSVGRQQLVPFSIPGQAPAFEEGDDSIVPSTPTLFVPRRGDGFAEAISSPHVPQGRFVFSNASSDQQGLSQLASQGALGVDDTRMDLSQFDEGCGRSVPSTPLQVSPPADAIRGELPEVGMAQEATLETSIPTITVTSEEDTSIGVQEEPTDSAGKTDPTPTVEEPDTAEVESVREGQEEKSSGLVIVDITSLAEDVEREESEENPTVTDPDEGNNTQEAETSDGASAKGSGQRKPIIWEGAAGTSSAATPAPQFSSPAPRATATTTQPRGRRLRVRGTTSNFAQRGGWGGHWRGRGGSSRSSQR